MLPWRLALKAIPDVAQVRFDASVDRLRSVADYSSLSHADLIPFAYDLALVRFFSMEVFR